MCHNEIRKSANQAIAFMQRHGFSLELAEDFSQEWIIKKYVLNKKQSLEQAYVDFLRKEIGNHQKISGRLKSAARLQLNSYHDNIHTIYNENCDRTLANYRLFLDRCERLEKIEKKDLIIINFLIDNQTTKIIARYFRQSEDSILNRVNKIKKKMGLKNLCDSYFFEYLRLSVNLFYPNIFFIYF